MSSRSETFVGQRLPSCRLILSTSPTAGLWNMAVDEALLDAAVDAEQAVLRWYTWSAPTVTLGYFQADDVFASDPKLNALPRVRRLTGGGAIVHHHEWTYSCVLPPKQHLVGHPYDLYDVLHDAVIAWFHDNQDVNLTKRAESNPAAEESPLCFLRSGKYDLCHAQVKILGSAQRRRKGAILQHGSLILKQSEFAPQIPGLCDSGFTAPLNARHAQTLAWRMAHAVGEKIAIGRLTEAEQRRADELVQQRST